MLNRILHERLLCGEGVFSAFSLKGLKESSLWISNPLSHESQFCDGEGSSLVFLRFSPEKIFAYVVRVIREGRGEVQVDQNVKLWCF